MDADSLQARIEHESAELRVLYPHIKDCHAALMRWTDTEGVHHSLHLDIRWPDHQTLVSGEATDDPATAIETGFAVARQRLDGATMRS